MVMLEMMVMMMVVVMMVMMVVMVMVVSPTCKGACTALSGQNSRCSKKPGSFPRQAPPLGARLKELGAFL